MLVLPFDNGPASGVNLLFSCLPLLSGVVGKLELVVSAQWCIVTAII